MSTVNGEKPRVVGLMSYETQQLVELLKKRIQADIEADEYSVISYAELSAACGRNVQKEGRENLDTAIKNVVKSTGRLIGKVPNQGVKLKDLHEEVSTGSDGLKRVKRLVNRRLRDMTLVRYDKLTQDQQHQHNTNASVLGAMSLFTRPKSVEKIEQAVEAANVKLAIGQTLSLFPSSNGSKQSNGSGNA